MRSEELNFSINVSEVLRSLLDICPEVMAMVVTSDSFYNIVRDLYPLSDGDHSKKLKKMKDAIEYGEIDFDFQKNYYEGLKYVEERLKKDFGYESEELGIRMQSKTLDLRTEEGQRAYEEISAWYPSLNYGIDPQIMYAEGYTQVIKSNGETINI